MKKFSIFCFAILPFCLMAEDVEEESELAYNQTDRSTEWGSNESSPKTNPRWYRNREAREAYLRGEKDYRSYPTKNNSNQNSYYKQESR